MASSDDIEGALVTQLNTLSGVQIAWENKAFNPPTSGQWLRVTHLPGVPVVQTIGLNPQTQHVGIFQVDVFDRLDNGDGPSRALALQVLGLFPAGFSVLRNGLSVRITKSYRLPAVREEQWYRLPVRVEWFATF